MASRRSPMKLFFRGSCAEAEAVEAQILDDTQFSARQISGRRQRHAVSVASKTTDRLRAVLDRPFLAKDDERRRRQHPLPRCRTMTPRAPATLVAQPFSPNFANAKKMDLPML